MGMIGRQRRFNEVLAIGVLRPASAGYGSLRREKEGTTIFSGNVDPPSPNHYNAPSARYPMLYRPLGRTGYQVSQLGFGAMHLPMAGTTSESPVDRELAIPMIRRAFDLGVNYIDSAVGYCNQDSQRAVGEALKGYRERIVVSTKNPNYGEDEKAWWTNLENSLERLQVEYIDIYNHHGINWKLYTEVVEPRIGKWMAKAKDQGLIKHVCCSFHDDNAGLRNIVDSGYPAVITLQYNLLDRQLEDGIAYAHEKGIGVVVMGPIAGGRLGAGGSAELEKIVPGIKRVPELALRFVLANQNISLALSGMATLTQVEENVAVANNPGPLSAEEIDAITAHYERLKKMADLYCSGCGYCMPCEQGGVNIPIVFNLYNQARVYGLWDHARYWYERMQTYAEQGNNPANFCKECGECEPKCPQSIAIRQQLAEAHAALVKA